LELPLLPGPRDKVAGEEEEEEAGVRLADDGARENDARDEVVVAARESTGRRFSVPAEAGLASRDEGVREG